MSVNLHRQSELRASEGDTLAAEGRLNEAQQAYREAAELERQVFDGIPKERSRTRGIIGVSIASLYYKGAALAEAESYASQYISDSSLPDFARDQLRDILEDIWQERRTIAAQRSTAGQAFLVALRGGQIGYGFTALDTLVLKLEQLDKLIVRTVELMLDRPFRERGPAGRDVQHLCRTTVGALSGGSFQFELKLEVADWIPTLEGFVPPTKLITAGQISSQLFNIMDHIVSSEPSTFGIYLSEDRYREVFLQLVRNFAPDGRDIGEISIQPIPSLARHAVVMTPLVRKKINGYFQGLGAQAHSPTEQVGTLRALDLDRDYIQLTEENGETKRCHIEEHKIFDDVVGPFVNRRVRVPGHWTGKGNFRRFVLHDIYLDDAEEPG
jgi:hypothetical protein